MASFRNPDPFGRTRARLRPFARATASPRREGRPLRNAALLPDWLEARLSPSDGLAATTTAYADAAIIIDRPPVLPPPPPLPPSGPILP